MRVQNGQYLGAHCVYYYQGPKLKMNATHMEHEGLLQRF